MIDKNMIPPEAVEAAARRLAQLTHQKLTLICPLAVAEHEFVETKWCSFALHARAAIAAALAAWPGVDYRPGSKVTKTWRDPGKIILPLPTEKSDD